MFQYNLRTLMFVMLGFAIASWVLFVIPGVVAVGIIAAIYVLLPGMAISGVVFFRSYGRAFCIATLPALAMTSYFLLTFADGPWGYGFGSDDQLLFMKLYMLGGMALIGIAGAGGLLVRYLAEPRQIPPRLKLSMAIDTPAKIAILGAGPIGLEAALYARFLGYDVVVFEAGEVADNVRRWGHVRMFTPFGMNRSPLGLAAIQAQDEGYRPPGDDELLTGNEWIERYLLPLSRTDLLAEHIRTNTRVQTVGKDELLKGDLPGDPQRGDWSFRILIADENREERVERADAVIDCTGVFGNPNHLGQGGIPVPGECRLLDMERGLPDISGPARPLYAAQHTLLIGAGYSAATNLLALAQLAREAPGTRVTWITRREGPAGATGPMFPIANDRLAQRAEVAREANRLTGDPTSEITHWPATFVERIDPTPGPAGRQFEVLLAGRHAGTLTCNQIIANVGFRPTTGIYSELQIQECHASQATLRPGAGPQSLVQPEPNFYILGAKSYGRKSDFLLSAGLGQIRDVFTIIGDRPTLDLYAGAHNLLR